MNVLILTSVLAGLGLTPDGERYAAEAQGWLLAGDSLPVDYLVRMRGLPPADRVTLVVFMRRSGLLTGAPVNLDLILAPAESPVDD